MGETLNSCRLCLSVGDESIFDIHHCTETPLSLKIMVCLSLPIMTSDSLPKLICSKCIKMINDFYSFREACINTYLKLMHFEKSARKYSEVTDGGCGMGANNVEVKGHISLNDYPMYDKSNVNDKTACLNSVGITYELEEVKLSNKQKDDAESNCDDEDGFDDQEPLSDMEIAEKDSVYNCSFVKKEQFVEATPFQQDEGDDEEEEEEEEEEDCFDSQEDTKIIKYVSQSKLINKEESPKICLTNLGLRKRYRCSGCIKVFPTVKALNKHLSVCQKDTESKHETISEEHYSDSELNSVGNKTVMSQAELEKVRWGEKRTYPCPTCGKVFTVLAVLRNHMTIHTGERPFLCSLCSRSFRQLGALRNHEMKHNGVSTHPCKLCGKGFFRPSDLQKHIRSHTGERPYMCSICSKAFHQLSGLLVHERIHTGERPYTCSICPMTFNQWANKHRHEKTHAGGAKPFACNVCHRKYSDEKEMKLHQAGHGGGRPRLCLFCKKGFRKPSELRDHLRRFHTNERPYKCEVCSKRFCASHEVKQHLLVHTGERPFQCSLCSQTFSQKGNLRRHHLRHHKDTPYTQDKVVIDSKDT